MTVTREDVADLRAGDIVTVKYSEWDEPVTGKLSVQEGWLMIAGQVVRISSGLPSGYLESLVVVERAPVPLYANHDRTEPVDRDAVIDCNGDAWQRRGRCWFSASFNGKYLSELNNAPLTLVFDGETRQVVR